MIPFRIKGKDGNKKRKTFYLASFFIVYECPVRNQRSWICKLSILKHNFFSKRTGDSRLSFLSKKSYRYVSGSHRISPPFSSIISCFMGIVLVPQWWLPIQIDIPQCTVCGSVRIDPGPNSKNKMKNLVLDGKWNQWTYVQLPLNSLQN